MKKNYFFFVIDEYLGTTPCIQIPRVKEIDILHFKDCQIHENNAYEEPIKHRQEKLTICFNSFENISLNYFPKKVRAIKLHMFLHIS